MIQQAPAAKAAQAQPEVQYRFVNGHTDGQLTSVTEYRIDPLVGMLVKTVPGDEMETKTIRKVHIVASLSDADIIVHRNRCSSDADRLVALLSSDKTDEYSLLIKYQFAERLFKLTQTNQGDTK